MNQFSDSEEHFLDARQLSCPLPLLKAKLRLAELSSGDILKISITDNRSLGEFQYFCQTTQNELVHIETGSDLCSLWIKKK